MKKKPVASHRFIAALALVALLFSAIEGNAIAAECATDAPDFLVLNPEGE